MHNFIIISELDNFLQQNRKKIKKYTTEIIQMKREIKMLDRGGIYHSSHEYFDGTIVTQSDNVNKIVLLSNIEKRECDLIRIKKQSEIFEHIIEILNKLPDENDDEIFFVDEIEGNNSPDEMEYGGDFPIEIKISEINLILDKLITSRLKKLLLRMKQVDKNMDADIDRTKLDVSLSIEEISEIIEEIDVLKFKVNDILNEL